jgi:16S rRNA (uracil1498-N3)-methyltransferase
MEAGARLLLTDGKGTSSKAIIKDNNRKRCVLALQDALISDPPKTKVSIAISLVKNVSRFEWFLEKATEIGVSEVIPLICERTEKEKFRADRLQGILVSAMLQSQQSWLPVLSSPLSLQHLIQQQRSGGKYIAHCLPEAREQLLVGAENGAAEHLILIGPEGDFTPREINDALVAGFLPVSLGSTRLRTETAGLVAAVLLTNKGT